jgi:hypothetical protein
MIDPLALPSCRVHRSTLDDEVDRAELLEEAGE